MAAATAPVEPTLPAQAVSLVGSSSGGLDELQSRMGLDGLLGRIHAPPKPEAKPEAADASKHDAAALPLATSLVSGAGASASGGQAETVTSSSEVVAPVSQESSPSPTSTESATSATLASAEGEFPVLPADYRAGASAAVTPTVGLQAPSDTAGAPSNVTAALGPIGAAADPPLVHGPMDTVANLNAEVAAADEALRLDAGAAPVRLVPSGPDESFSSSAQAAVDTVSLADKDAQGDKARNLTEGEEAAALAEAASADALAAEAKAQAAQAEAEAVVAEAAVRTAKAEQQAHLNAQALSEAEAALKITEAQSRARIEQAETQLRKRGSSWRSSRPG